MERADGWGRSGGEFLELLKLLLELLGGLGELLLCALGILSGRLGVLEDLLNVGAREQLKDLEGL